MMRSVIGTAPSMLGLFATVIGERAALSGSTSAHPAMTAPAGVLPIVRRKSRRVGSVGLDFSRSSVHFSSSEHLMEPNSNCLARARKSGNRCWPGCNRPRSEQPDNSSPRRARRRQCARQLTVQGSGFRVRGSGFGVQQSYWSPEPVHVGRRISLRNRLKRRAFGTASDAQSRRLHRRGQISTALFR